MKVLWFSNTPAGGDDVLMSGGTRGGWLFALDKALRSKVELSVAFYYARYTEPFENDGVMYYPICKRNWKLNIIKRSLIGDFRDREDLPVYLDIIYRVRPDIIHIHGAENPFGCIMEVVDIPVVLSYQGSSTIYNHKYYSGIEKSYAAKKNIRLFSPLTWVFSKSFNWGYRESSHNRNRETRNLKLSKHIIGRTDWDRRISRILAPHSSYYHNDEILRDSFYRHEWKKSGNNTFVIHTTTGESIFKGFETVCQALNELNKIGIDIEWRVAGVSGNSLLDKIVKKKLKSHYPSRGLVLLGNLNEKELLVKMLEADIYVMPSHIENSPNSLCEAMILGMPCITTLAGGSLSLLKDKEEGLVIQDGDPWSMAGAILELSQNPQLAAKYGQRARARALNRHNPENIVNDLLKIYQNIIGQPLNPASAKASDFGRHSRRLRPTKSAENA